MQKTFLYFVEGLLLHLSILFYLLGQINPSKLVIMCHLNKIIKENNKYNKNRRTLQQFSAARQKKKAKEAFDFVVKTAGKHSFLGEQIDNETLKPNWVIGLGWSHAMFIIVLEKLMKS